MKGPAGFQGFEEPPAHSDPNAPSWSDRLVALSSNYPDVWAKYGPYASYRTASHASCSVRSVAEESLDIQAESTYGEIDGEFYVYVRAHRRGARLTPVEPLFKAAEGDTG